jgi:hypothetical protein
MPNIDPTVRFWISIIVTVAVGVSQGALNLTHAVPVDLIPVVTAWSGIFAFVGSAFLAALNGAASTNSSRIASAAAVVGVKKIEVTPEVASQVTPATKLDAQIVTVPGAVEIAAAEKAAPPAAAVAAPPAAEVAVDAALARRDAGRKP